MSYAFARRCRSSVRSPVRSPVRSSVGSSAAVAAVLFAATAASAAETYPVKLDRPEKVGQEFAVTAKADVNTTAKVTANGQAQPDKEEKYTVELTGTEKVEAVNDKIGAPTKVTMTVEKLTKDGTDLFPAGTVITADYTGKKKSFTVDGTAVGLEKAGVLEAVIEVESADREVTDEQMLGTDKPQAVGGTWDGDSAKAAEMMSKQDLPVKADHLKVTSKLVAVKVVDGTPSEVVESTVKADALEADKTTGGLTVTEGSVEATVTQTLPTDATLPPTTVDAHFVFNMKGTAGGGAVSADIKAERTTHRTMSPKK